MQLCKHISLAMAWITIVGFYPAVGAAQTTKVDVIYPTVSSNQQVLSLVGTIDAQQHARLAPLQSGVIAELFAEEGDMVAAGQILLTLDARLAELALAEADASMKAARENQKEAERLYLEITELSKRQLVAETLLAERRSAFSVANANLNQSMAKLEQQREVLKRHTLFAPFAGVIAQRHVDVGEWVTQQAITFTLVEQAKLRLRVAIPQEYAQQLSTDEDIEVKVIPDGIGAIPYQGKLNRLVRVASGNSRTLTGLINLPPRRDWVTGASAHAEIYLPNQQNNMVWLPKSAVKQHPDGGRSIFAIVDNKAKRHFVTVMQQQADKVAVSGAPTGLPIVSSGIALLRDGDLLEIGQVLGNGS